MFSHLNQRDSGGSLPWIPAQRCWKALPAVHDCSPHNHKTLCPALWETESLVSSEACKYTPVQRRGGFLLFALCIFVETYITYMYGKRSIYFGKPWLLHLFGDPSGGRSALGEVVSETPCPSVQRLFPQAVCLILQENRARVVYMGCFGGMGITF